RPGGRRMVDGRIEQPRSAQPVAQPGSQCHYPGPRIHQRARAQPGQPDAEQLPRNPGTGSEGIQPVAPGTGLLPVPRAAPLSFLDRLAACPYAAPGTGGYPAHARRDRAPDRKGRTMTDPGQARPRTGLRSRPWWPWAMRGLNLAFLALVAY